LGEVGAFAFVALKQSASNKVAALPSDVRKGYAFLAELN
jgi:hypothetical protein